MWFLVFIETSLADSLFGLYVSNRLKIIRNRSKVLYFLVRTSQNTFSSFVNLFPRHFRFEK